MTFEQALEAMKNGKQVILQHEHNGVSSIYDKIPVEWITLDGWIEEGD